MNLKNGWELVRQSVSAWIDDYAPSMGAALAYYTIFSIAPLLIIIIAVAGFAFGQEAVQGQLAAQLSELVGREGAQAIQGLIASASEPKKGVIATVIGIVVLLIGATTVFGELQSALDRIWRVPAAKEASGLWNLLRTRLLSFGMVLGVGFLLLVSLVISAALAAFGARWGSAINDWEPLLQLLNVAVSFALEMGLFAMIYKVMPSARIAWRDVLIGAGVTALLFELGKLLIGLYLGKSGVASGFGAAGSIVVLLLWVYYSAQIFLLGAEFTWVYAHHHGSKVGKALPGQGPPIPCRSDGASAPTTTASTGSTPENRGVSVAPQPEQGHQTVAMAPSNVASGGTATTKVRMVRDHPIKGLGVVVAAGLVAGTLVGRTLRAPRTRGWFRRWRWFA